jgi:hypothetical protein
MARACQLWERAGRPENREEEFWYAAQQELRNKDLPRPDARRFGKKLAHSLRS